MNGNFEKTLSWMVYSSLFVLALGVLTSTTLLSLSHIFMIIPGLYFVSKIDFKKVSGSSWAILALVFSIIISVLANQDIAVKGYRPILKAKYFLIGFLSILPIGWYLKNYYDEKKISWLLYAFCLATSLATLSGLSGTFFGYIPWVDKTVPVGGRYGGFFGMVMNYAHNMSYFLIILIGLLLNHKIIKKWINIKFLIVIFIINVIGFYFSYTRGAWLALLAGVPFFFFKNHKAQFFSIIAGLGILGTCAYFLAGENVIRPQSEKERISQWKSAIKAFEERPVFGYGYLNFEEHSSIIKKRYGLEAPKFRSHAHNNFLEMLAGTGFIGFCAFIAWLFLWFKEMYKADDLISKIGVPFIIVFVVGGLTQSTISLGINLFFIVAAWSIAVAFQWSRK